MAIAEELARGTDGRRRIGLKSPATLEPAGEITVATADDVRAAVAAARAAQPAWGATPVAERARIVRSALDVLIRRKDELVEILIRESGKTRTEATAMELVACCDFLNYWSARAPDDLADEWRKLHGYMRPLKKLLVTYRPLGVVGIITPWNGPLALSLNPTVQALLAGNAVILKPSEISPRSGAAAAELLLEAGVPAGVLQVLQGDGETGAALVDAGVDKISFTGSVATGKKVAASCARQLIPCTLELGGKDAMIVCADADLDRAAHGAVFASVLNTGQICMSVERIYVVEAVADAFIAKVTEVASKVRWGAPNEAADVGPLFWDKQLAIVERQVEEAKKSGARAVVGGERDASRPGLFFKPTVLVDLNHDMAVMRDETFGPVVAVQRVKDEDDAIRMANDSPYGLSGSVWTKDIDKGIRLAKRMATGSVTINDAAVIYGVPEAPFGGLKESGVGRVNGVDALKDYSHALPILIHRWNTKRERAWYPFTDKSFKEIEGALKLFGPRIRNWLA